MAKPARSEWAEYFRPSFGPSARQHARCTASLTAASLMPGRLTSVPSASVRVRSGMTLLPLRVDPAEHEALLELGRLEPRLQGDHWTVRRRARVGQNHQLALAVGVSLGLGNGQHPPPGVLAHVPHLDGHQLAAAQSGDEANQQQRLVPGPRDVVGQLVEDLPQHRGHEGGRLVDGLGLLPADPFPHAEHPGAVDRVGMAREAVGQHAGGPSPVALASGGQAAMSPSAATVTIPTVPAGPPVPTATGHRSPGSAALMKSSFHSYGKADPSLPPLRPWWVLRHPR